MKTPPSSPRALRRAEQGRVWADRDRYPLTVAVLEMWARPWSLRAVQRAAWLVIHARARGIPVDLSDS